MLLATGALAGCGILLKKLVKDQSGIKNLNAEEIDDIDNSDNANNIHRVSSDTGAPASAEAKNNFIKNFISVLIKAIPSLYSKEVLNIMLLLIALASRTMVTIHISEVNGQIVKALMNRELSDFVSKLVAYLVYSFPASMLNSAIIYLDKLISLQLRRNLTDHFHKVYISDKCYYQITNLDSRVVNPDNIIASDIDKWSQNVAMLYTNLLKPVLDIVLFTRKLSQGLGFKGPVIMLVWYLLSSVVMRALTPPFGKMVSHLQCTNILMFSVRRSVP